MVWVTYFKQNIQRNWHALNDLTNYNIFCNICMYVSLPLDSLFNVLILFLQREIEIKRN